MIIKKKPITTYNTRHEKGKGRTKLTTQIDNSTLQCNIQTRGENKKNNPDTKQIITTVQHTN